MMKLIKHFIFRVFLCFFPVVMSGCLAIAPQKTAAQHQQELGSTQERKMTLGLVQSSIKEGSSQADVATALGSPNIVTQDEKGNDTWIYDKISTENTHSGSSASQASAVSGGGGLGILGEVGSALVGGVVGVSGASVQGSSSNTGASSQSQKTLTVVIKFNEKKQVNSIKYQSSSF